MMNIFSLKEKTKRLEIKNMEDVQFYHISLSQNIGKPAIPIVKTGDKVLKYQLIAKADGQISIDCQG